MRRLRIDHCRAESFSSVGARVEFAVSNHFGLHMYNTRERFVLIDCGSCLELSDVPTEMVAWNVSWVLMEWRRGGDLWSLSASSDWQSAVSCCRRSSSSLLVVRRRWPENSQNQIPCDKSVSESKRSTAKKGIELLLTLASCLETKRPGFMSGKRNTKSSVASACSPFIHHPYACTRRGRECSNFFNFNVQIISCNYESNT